MKTIINVDGMSCENCEKHVKNAILEIPGVSKVDVSLENNTATIEHEQSVTIEMIKEAVEDVGYDVV